MVKKNLLVFPLTSEVGRELVRSFSGMKEYTLYGAGVDNPGILDDENFQQLPTISNQEFDVEFFNVLKRFRIDLVYPAMDMVLVKLSDIMIDRVEAKLIASPSESIEVCFSKDLTYERLSNLDFVPEMYSAFPNRTVFVKPKIGYGSKGIRKVSTLAEFNSVKESELAVEYLPGEEYTVECLSGNNGELFYCFGRERLEIKSGIAVKTTAAAESVQLEVLSIARQILSRISLIGAWFFQVKRAENGVLKLLEVAPRIAGSMALSRMRGVNLPHLSILAMEGVNINVMAKNAPRTLSRSLDTNGILDFKIDKVFLDFDDCILLNDKELNPWAVAYIVHSRNKNRHIAIISRHKGDLNTKLVDLKIYQLIDEVIHLTSNERKSDFISGEFIFFDDSFSERREVGIAKDRDRVFDVVDFEWVLKGDI